MEEAPGMVFVEIRDTKGGGACRVARRRGDAMGGGAHRGKARKRPASRWRCFKRKYVFFPGEGFKGSEGSKCVYSGRVWVPEIHERGREKRSLSTTGALVKRARRRERARA